jgi:hypothetical protein
MSIDLRLQPVPPRAVRRARGLFLAEAGTAGMICASYGYHPSLVRAEQKALADSGG